jgi:hypothetical protein
MILSSFFLFFGDFRLGLTSNKGREEKDSQQAEKDMDFHNPILPIINHVFQTPSWVVYDSTLVMTSGETSTPLPASSLNRP